MSSCSFFLLQESLRKFVGRTLKDCGEDLLVEISEILFNELAFFRLMQDLDNGSSTSSATKAKSMKMEQKVQTKHSPEVSFYFWYFEHNTCKIDPTQK